jgi:hypothetical protein
MIPGCSAQNVHSFAPFHEAEPEPGIQDTITTIHNPFDNAQSQVIGTHKKGYKKTKRKSKKSQQEHKDPELKEAIRRGLDVQIHYDSSR